VTKPTSCRPINFGTQQGAVSGPGDTMRPGIRPSFGGSWNTGPPRDWRSLSRWPGRWPRWRDDMPVEACYLELAEPDIATGVKTVSCEGSGADCCRAATAVFGGACEARYSCGGGGGSGRKQRPRRQWPAGRHKRLNMSAHWSANEKIVELSDAAICRKRFRDAGRPRATRRC